MFVKIKVGKALEGIAEAVLVDWLIATDGEVRQSVGQLRHDGPGAEHHLA